MANRESSSHPPPHDGIEVAEGGGHHIDWINDPALLRTMYVRRMYQNPGSVAGLVEAHFIQVSYLGITCQSTRKEVDRPFLKGL